MFNYSFSNSNFLEGREMASVQVQDSQKTQSVVKAIQRIDALQTAELESVVARIESRKGKRDWEIKLFLDKLFAISTSGEIEIRKIGLCRIELKIYLANASTQEIKKLLENHVLKLSQLDCDVVFEDR